MMISVEYYIKQLENEMLPTLIKERDSLIRTIRKLEKELFEPKNYIPVYPDPQPDVQYKMYLEYLSALCGLMEKKYDKCPKLIEEDGS